MSFWVFDILDTSRIFKLDLTQMLFAMSSFSASLSHLLVVMDACLEVCNFLFWTLETLGNLR